MKTFSIIVDLTEDVDKLMVDVGFTLGAGVVNYKFSTGSDSYRLWCRADQSPLSNRQEDGWPPVDLVDLKGDAYAQIDVQDHGYLTYEDPIDGSEVVAKRPGSQIAGRHVDFIVRGPQAASVVEAVGAAIQGYPVKEEVDRYISDVKERRQAIREASAVTYREVVLDGSTIAVVDPEPPKMVFS